MPSRIIRESALTSKTLDQLSDGAERLFWRLTLVADDWGRFDPTPEVILSKAFPLKIKVLSVKKIIAWVEELIKVGLIEFYVSENRLIASFITWKKYQRIRNKSKFPDPPQIAANGGNSPQLAADCGRLQQVLQKLSLDMGYRVLDIGNREYLNSTSPLKAASSGEVPVEWPEQELWLKDFLEKQNYLNGDYKSQLLVYEWWDQVSVAVNGIDEALLEREFAKMAAWISENPNRKPTAKGIRKFVRGWLERAYEKERKQR